MLGKYNERKNIICNFSYNFKSRDFSLICDFLVKKYNLKYYYAMYPSNIFKNKNLLHLYIIYISIKKFSFKHNSTQDKIPFFNHF